MSLFGAGETAATGALAGMPAAGAAQAVPATGPLAEILRPQTLDAVIGQTHLLGPGMPPRVAFETAKPHSMILWGPPGVGKTTLARLIARGFQFYFIAISAVLGGVKEIREAVKSAEESRLAGRRTMLFVDEVHRFNKAVNQYINKRFTKVIAQIIGLPHGSREGNHG